MNKMTDYIERIMNMESQRSKGERIGKSERMSALEHMESINELAKEVRVLLKSKYEILQGITLPL